MTKARFKLDDWIEEYKSEDGTQYIIPSYKIERLREIEKENEELRKSLKVEFSNTFTDQEVKEMRGIMKQEKKKSCVCIDVRSPMLCPVHGPK